MDLQFRKTCRAKVTRLIKEAEDLLKAEIAVEELSVMLDRLTVANNNLKEANEKALPHVKEEKYEEEFEQILDYDDRVAIATSRLKQRVSSQTQAEEQGSRQNAASIEGNKHRGDSCQRQQQAVPDQEQGVGISGVVYAAFNTLKVEFNKLSEFDSDAEECSSQERADTSTIKCEKQIELLLKFIKREVDSVESAQAISGTASTSSGVSREERNSIGFLGPYTIIPKILLQTIWKGKYDWDSTLPQDIQREWKIWIKDIKLLNDLTFPRCVVKNLQIPVQLHIFADASPKAYGAVAYIRICENNINHSNIFMSKSRVAPIKQSEDELSLPRLELTAAVCAARLKNYIMKNVKLNVKSIYLWTDSKITLRWIIEKPERWKPYVANRVREIQSLTKDSVWRHCPGQDNPADLVTRGIKANKLITSTLWKFGPYYLRESEESWPEDDDEMMDDYQGNFVLNTQTVEEVSDPLFDLNRYSSINKILRVTSYVLRFISNVKFKQKIVGNLGVEELKRSEVHWLKYIQNKEFPAETKSLKNNELLPRTSAILSLSPFLDHDGLMRLGGRLQESELSYETQHPIILPKSSPWINKIITHTHEKLHHGGVNITLAEIRKKYWILRGRQKIKSILSRCVTCKKFRGKPGDTQFAPLPRERILSSRAFDVIGTDFAGPLYIKEKEQIRKVYVMLITCVVTRAVHLELVPNISTECCLRGLRRFMARRGVPSVIYSDNAKSFKRSALELEEFNTILRGTDIHSFALKSRITWKFIVERAAWWGGFWERLVKTIKDSLKFNIGKAILGFDELQTVLTEVEAIVNSRPLTYIDDDPDNMCILTPEKFLIGDAVSNITKDIRETAIKRNDLLQKWKTREISLNKFWRKWTTDYLQQLRTAHHFDPKRTTSFETGDVVLLHDQNMPRTLWKMVRITNIYQGRDGKVRACEIRVPNGKLLKRPIQLLYPLELETEGKVLRTSGPEDYVENKNVVRQESSFPRDRYGTVESAAASSSDIVCD
ncbi:uncharacterized protein LOC108916094 [Anoplophora glabripennis]|uniref:uncharacterized protein LOC108916094 n=1 Tax=Anoplophora glabripennis TaxID=217634 RepID=UPI0008756895|nr:uncharacterized protein LOC108916094 [Anoplophora glabripennis]